VSVEVSIVIPLHNQEQNLSALHLRLSATLRRLAIPFEIIYVDDGSTDNTARYIHELHQQDNTVKGIILSRSFGTQSALWAGLEIACGRAVVTMGSDLLDPPEIIPVLIEKWRDGAQVAFARPRPGKAGVFKQAMGNIVCTLLEKFSGLHIPLDAGDFALLDRQVVTQLKHLPERTHFISGLRSWIGFDQVEVNYDYRMAYKGRPSYRLLHQIRQAIVSVVTFSNAPLTAIGIMGVVLMLMSLGGIFFAGISSAKLTPHTAGMIWLGLGSFLLAGIQLTCIGILGAYTARIYREARNRPFYVTRERIGFESNLRPAPNVLEYMSVDINQRQEMATEKRLKTDRSHVLSIVEKNKREGAF